MIYFYIIVNNNINIVQFSTHKMFPIVLVRKGLTPRPDMKLLTLQLHNIKTFNIVIRRNK